MKLNYHPNTKAFTLEVLRGEADPHALMTEEGLDWWQAGSTAEKAILTTKEPHAAAYWHQHATPEALAVIKPIVARVAESWALTSDARIAVPSNQELMPFQKASVAYALKRQHALIADVPGLGKENPVDTPVLTPSGWRTMGELRVGDEVISVDGTPTKVIGVFPQGVKEEYEVTFRDRTSSRCGGDHLWTVSKWGKGPWVVLTTKALLEGGLCKPVGPRVGAKWRIPLMAPVQFSAKAYPIDPYVLGVLIGDGSTAEGKATFSNPDFDADIRSFVTERLPTGAVLKEDRRANCPQFHIQFPDTPQNPIRRALKTLGLNVLSKVKQIPQEYLLGSVVQRLDLLRGLMDTDGSCTKNRTTFHTVSRGLAEGVAGLVRSLGGVAIVREYDRAHQNKPLEFCVNVKLTVCPFYTSRKKAQWYPAHQPPCRSIRSIHATGKFSEQVCIRVNHLRSLYVINDYIVTHNTPQAIAFANEIKAKSILLIVPASIRRQWAKRIREWTTIPYGEYLIYNIESARNGVHPTATWTIVSYDLLRSEPIIKALTKRHFDLMIMDEAHMVKTPESARTRAIFGGGDKRVAEPLFLHAERTLALTGTPLVNRPRECFVLAKALCYDSIDWLSERAFRERFNPGARIEGTRADGSTYIYNREAVGRQGELQMRLRSNFMVRHLKRDVLPQLKLPVYDVVLVDETSAVKQALAAENLLDIDPDKLDTGDFEVLGHVAAARRMMGEAIAPQVVEYAKMLLDGGEDKLVIFAWHISVLDILEAGLQSYGVRRVDGSTSASGKEKIIDEFQSNPRVRVVIGNVMSLGTGTDGLQNACSHCLLAEPDWVPGNNVQAIDRLDRFGQARTVHAELFCAPRSISEKVLTSALRKAKTIHKALDRVV